MDRRVSATDSASADERTFAAWIDPLGFAALDDPVVPAGYTVVGQELPTAEDFLQFLCDAELSSDVSSLAARYREIHAAARRLFAPPAQREILGKLIWPLRHAQSSFVLGNYLGTISLGGFVAEMLAILLYETHLLETTSDRRTQQTLSAKFERRGQQAREQELAGLHLIPEGCEHHFEEIRTLRQRYLHYFSRSHTGIERDAGQVFRLATELTVAVIGQTILGGGVHLQPALVKYLAQHG